jgi:fumarylacetoacetate (FAA) hydrolase
MVQFPWFIKVDVIALASRKVGTVKPRNVCNFTNGALPKRADAFMLTRTCRAKGSKLKLASIKSGRDGRLVVVSDDLAWCADASHIAPTLQAALDHWTTVEAALRNLATDLAHEAIPMMRFHERDAASPLPRAYGWADGSAYVNHVALVRQARGADMPDSFWHDPLMYQGGSCGFLAPRDPIPLGDGAWGCDMEAEVVVVTGDVPMGISAEAARAHIVLIGLTNDVSLRGLIADELAKGFGFFQSKPASAFSPVFVTPDTLGARWDGAKLHGALCVDYNGTPLGRADAGVDMTFDFGQLIAHAAKTRNLCAGTIIGSGTVSNRDAAGGPGKAIAAGGLGYSCLAEVRTVETIENGTPQTPFMKSGDTVRIWMEDDKHHPIFGVIEQSVVAS